MEENQIVGKGLLLVEDDFGLREMLKTVLSIDAFTVVETNNGVEAISLFARSQFDLVMTDFEIPFMKGNELAARIKQLAPWQPILMITGYPSAIEPKTDHVLLDVLFEGKEAPHCEPALIATPFITPEREVRVPVPTINSLLGDKLTAFALRTIGILYNPLRKTDIAKQRFDVAALFDVATDLRVAAAVYAATHARQLVYRQAAFTLAETLNDSIEAAFLYNQLDLRGGKATEHGLFLHDGIIGLQNHTVNQPFRRDEAM